MTQLIDNGRWEFTRPVFEDPLVRTALDRLFTAWDDMETDGAALATAACEEALTHTCGLLARHHSNRCVASAAPAALNRVRECLLDQCTEPPSLDQLAQLAGLSRFQLVRQFARWQGLPPFVWLQQQRLQRAQQMILAGTPLSEVATACGFSDQSHLNRQFVRSFGFTPGHWRQAFAGSLQ